MTKQKRFSIKKTIGFAVNGLRILIKEEHNARIHLFVAGVVIIASIGFGISAFEWMAVILAIGFVVAQRYLIRPLKTWQTLLHRKRMKELKKSKICLPLAY